MSNQFQTIFAKYFEIILWCWKKFTLTPARLGNNSWFFSFSIELCFEILLLRCRLKFSNRIFVHWKVFYLMKSSSKGSFAFFWFVFFVLFFSKFHFRPFPILSGKPQTRDESLGQGPSPESASLVTRQSGNRGRMKLNLEIKYCLNSFFEFTPIWNNLCVWFCCFLWYFIDYLTVWRLFHFCHFRQKLSFHQNFSKFFAIFLKFWKYFSF